MSTPFWKNRALLHYTLRYMDFVDSLRKGRPSRPYFIAPWLHVLRLTMHSRVISAPFALEKKLCINSDTLITRHFCIKGRSKINTQYHKHCTRNQKNDKSMFDQLQSLKLYMHRDYHFFYDNLYWFFWIPTYVHSL